MCKNIEECTGKQFNDERINTVIKQYCFGSRIDKQVTGTNQRVHKQLNKCKNVIY